MAKLEKFDIEKLEKLLRRPLSDQEGCRADYDEITDADLSDIKNIVSRRNIIDAVKYVLFLLKHEKGTLPNAVSFVDYVVNENVDVKEWLKKYYRP